MNSTHKQDSLPLRKQIDMITTVIPFLMILGLCILFVFYPEDSSLLLENIRTFIGEKFGGYYLVLGLGVFFCSFFLCFSKYGSIKLGNIEKPEYSNFKWGSMMFTAGLAADIIFYSFCEWILYATDPYVQGLGNVNLWSSTYPLFHWGPIPWSFYLVLAVSFGFMLHIRKRPKQKYSEACRPILGSHTDGLPGRFIDCIAIFALLAGTATTFSLATPLLSLSISRLFGLPETTVLTLVILLVVCCIYTCSVYFGMKGIVRAAGLCIYLLFTILLYVLLFGGETLFILENGIMSLGNLAQNFLQLSTYTDPLRENSFPQTWTIFYWAYWMVWCVAAPFFIGSISKGRTIKQVVLGGYGWGFLGTFISFIILGNYGLGLRVHNRLDLVSFYEQSGNIYHSVLALIDTLPMPQIFLLILILCMIAFYSTSFDSITLVASAYSYKKLDVTKEPHKRVKLFWAIFLILLPLALLFSEKSMANLQTVSIIVAFPIGFIILLIITSFFKDANAYLKEQDK